MEDIKKVLDEYKEDTRRQLMIFFEGVDRRFSLLAEAIESLR